MSCCVRSLFQQCIQDYSIDGEGYQSASLHSLMEQHRSPYVPILQSRGYDANYDIFVFSPSKQYLSVMSNVEELPPLADALEDKVGGLDGSLDYGVALDSATRLRTAVLCMVYAALQSPVTSVRYAKYL